MSNENESSINNELVTDRQPLIDTAIRFLNNPKVIPTSSENKRFFLLKKGLTESEVKQAFKLANVKEDDVKTTNEDLSKISNGSSNPSQVSIVKNESNKSLIKKENLWSKILRWIRNILITGCLTYSAYELIIKRYFFDDYSKRKKKVNNLTGDTKDELKMNESINEMRNTLKSLKETVENMNNLVKQINTSKMTNTATTSFEDNSGIKNEIQSIKSLLLNRTQFPSLPKVSPIIPSWQLETKNNNNHTDENSPMPNENNFFQNEPNEQQLKEGEKNQNES